MKWTKVSLLLPILTDEINDSDLLMITDISAGRNNSSKKITFGQIRTAVYRDVMTELELLNLRVSSNTEDIIDTKNTVSNLSRTILVVLNKVNEGELKFNTLKDLVDRRLNERSSDVDIDDPLSLLSDNSINILEFSEDTNNRSSRGPTLLLIEKCKLSFYSLMKLSDDYLIGLVISNGENQDIEISIKNNQSGYVGLYGLNDPCLPSEYTFSVNYDSESDELKFLWNDGIYSYVVFVKYGELVDLYEDETLRSLIKDLDVILPDSYPFIPSYNKFAYYCDFYDSGLSKLLLDIYLDKYDSIKLHMDNNLFLSLRVDKLPINYNKFYDELHLLFNEGKITRLEFSKYSLLVDKIISIYDLVGSGHEQINIPTESCRVDTSIMVYLLDFCKYISSISDGESKNALNSLLLIYNKLLLKCKDVDLDFELRDFYIRINLIPENLSLTFISKSPNIKLLGDIDKLNNPESNTLIRFKEVRHTLTVSEFWITSNDISLIDDAIAIIYNNGDFIETETGLNGIQYEKGSESSLISPDSGLLSTTDDDLVETELEVK